MNGEQITAVAANLRRDGYCILPYRMAADDIATLTRFAFSTPAIGVDMQNDIRISADDIPCGEGRYVWWSHDLIQLPAVQRLLAEGPFCAIAQEYLQCRPILTSVMLWIDPQYRGPYGAHTYHHDNDGPGFLKFFIYLNDVGLENGAHRFIKGSHSHRKPPQFARARLYKDEELFGFYSRERELVAAAPSGTILAEDTAGFHRGSTITDGYRLLLQLQFSVVDIPHEQELARKLVPVALPLHPGIAKIVRKFFVPST
jgi:hypothetical protein